MYRRFGVTEYPDKNANILFAFGMKLSRISSAWKSPEGADEFSPCFQA
jgi:hypothetical protein